MAKNVKTESKTKPEPQQEAKPDEGCCCEKEPNVGVVISYGPTDDPKRLEALLTVARTCETLAKALAAYPNAGVQFHDCRFDVGSGQATPRK